MARPMPRLAPVISTLPAKFDPLSFAIPKKNPDALTPRLRGQIAYSSTAPGVAEGHGTIWSPLR
jgi:hypothetical protein